MNTKTIITGIGIVGGTIAAAALFGSVAVVSCIVVGILTVALVTFLWNRFINFWMNKLQMWVSKCLGEKICEVLGKIISFLNKPFAIANKGMNAIKDAWNTFRDGLGCKTRYKKDGEEVIIETRMVTSEEEIIVQKREQYYELPAETRTKLICSDDTCYEVDNFDVLDRRIADVEAELSN